MKKLFLATAALTLLFSCGKKFETTENGVKYKILSHDENAKPIGKGDLILVNLILKTEHDSIILETFKKNTPRYIPFEEPVLTQVFAMLSKGDSVEALVNADTLFMKSFGMPKPANIKSGENIRFIMKIVESLDQKEILKKRADQQKELMVKDSMAVNALLSTLKDVQQTPSGLRYVVETATKGKQPKSGDKLSVRYKGMLLSGEVFDATKEDAPPFTFTVGLSQVIRGWDEGLLLMHEGEKCKFIIPAHLAYGEGGQGPIPPMSTLVFEVELVKIN